MANKKKHSLKQIAEKLSFDINIKKHDRGAAVWESYNIWFRIIQCDKNKTS